ncbi:oxidoreductase domain protein [Thermobaculum terrenum ATCC BAA-798]|uniref:Oxidoreductase domain protein n=1 Tax=Thermobaculum terrenum (strain ATCC BAA-798 / CCMEE 7001 / YNP1) TaxID=525904 RepID=D1CB56_THET1|nr:Gfo/Idh/MocA family oxidoreductase [Thermobaculum terrenum]ACZ42021.1 oxidoreductase domain protein [Thermobaculum terrenum ATCC BAA-798]
MSEHIIGIILNGVTGRMGARQHLERSIVAIMKDGGILLPSGNRIVIDPLLVGRNPNKLRQLAETYGIPKWTTDLDCALSDPNYQIYFDSQTTALRVPALTKAINAGKHVYCEKPVALDLSSALELAKLARIRGVKNGVVQDKLFLPGFRKLRRVIDSEELGRLLAVRADFGYWVFERGDEGGLQRPSWNYRREDGGGIILDMFCHWRYLLDNLFGNVISVCCIGAIHIPERYDEFDRKYQCTAEDAAYALFQLEGNVIAQFNSSWATRVRREDLFVLQVDGTDGSAVATLRDCWVQPSSATPRAIWDPDSPHREDYFSGWLLLPDRAKPDNAFRLQWEMFIKHVVADTPFPWDLLEGAKGVQLAELAMLSWRERRWIDVPPLNEF